MKVYPLSEGSVAIVDPETEERYEGDHVNGIELPHHLGQHLLDTHIGGAKAYESDAERSIRLVDEKDAEERDPKSLLAEIRSLKEALLAKADGEPDETVDEDEDASEKDEDETVEAPKPSTGSRAKKAAAKPE